MSDTVCGALRWSGRVIHRRGAAKQKARSPIVRVLVLRQLSRWVLVEWRDRTEVYGMRSSVRYGGALPWMQ